MDIETFLERRKHLPLVDVRSESEFREGHIAGAINIPVLNDSERVVVGTTYKQQGQTEAIMAGFRLVGPRLADIVEAALNVGPELLVHCWRGGMRSGNFCRFVEMARVKTHSLDGGYKAYRQYAMASFNKDYPFRIIAGYTGSGKSDLLRALQARGEQIIDLEALASHKGSVFGGLGMPEQPTTEQFQNNLFEALRKLDPTRRIWIEDESIAVGKIFLPHDLWNHMGEAPVAVVDVDQPTRVRRLVDEYGSVAPELFLDAMSGIVKKLGGQHYQAARDRVMAGSMAEAIEILLTYYDKAYRNGIERKKARIAFTIPWSAGTDSSTMAALLIEQADRHWNTPRQMKFNHV